MRSAAAAVGHVDQILARPNDLPIVLALPRPVFPLVDKSLCVAVQCTACRSAHACRPATHAPHSCRSPSLPLCLPAFLRAGGVRLGHQSP